MQASKTIPARPRSGRSRSLGIFGKRRRPAAEARSAEGEKEAGGIIAIGGPPLGGKALLAARLAELLPSCLRLEAVDDLSARDALWFPEGPGSRSVRNPTRALLTRAAELWKDREAGRPPVILISTRFATPQERKSAQRLALSLGARFLFVEARSRDTRALRRIPIHRLSRSEEEKRWRRYEDALVKYRPLDAAEAAQLPAVRLTRVHSGLEQAVARVVKAWET